MFDFQCSFEGAATRVVVRPGLLADVGALLADIAAPAPACLVTDHRVADLYAERAERSLRSAGFSVDRFTVPVGEASKSLTVASDLYDALARRRLGRDGLIVALGGGVVSDLAGFAAATWLRGVRFAILPTTLEADVDAALGGKTAVNIAAGKNLVGAFHHPLLVAVDTKCLATLDPRDVIAGLAESVKHALLWDGLPARETCDGPPGPPWDGPPAPSTFDDGPGGPSHTDFLAWHEDHVDDILKLDEPTITELIGRNLQWKARVVESDPRETREDGLRRIFLNFGHTVGHAIESCCAYRLRHGECVALGMIAAARLGREIGVTPVALVERLERLLSAFGLPTTMDEPIPADQIIERIRVDKKAKGGRVQLVLVEDVGRPVVRTDVSEEALLRAYESLSRRADE